MKRDVQFEIAHVLFIDIVAYSRKTIDPRVPELRGYIEGPRGKHEESLRNLQRAIELDPRNFFTLEQIALRYQNLRRYQDMKVVLDRALAIQPGDLKQEPPEHS